MLRNLVRSFRQRSKLSNKRIQFFDHDVFLVSYPKSGNTWLRFLLAHYAMGRSVSLKETNLLIPDIHYNSEDINDKLNPRIIKTHERYTHKYRRVIYIVRDGRDVAVSYFFHLKKFKRLPADIKFCDFLDEFIRGGYFSTSWGKHVDEWLDLADNLLLIRYEDMLSNSENVLREVVRFCKLELDETRILDSVAACTIKELRSKEVNEFDNVKELSTSDPKVFFFRKGVSGDWKNYLNTSDNNKFIAAFSKTMTRVGYLSN